MSTPRESFKTKKGTELPLLNLRGKEYLAVAQRLVWFREEHPDWTIVTEIEDKNWEQMWVIMRAVIMDKDKRILAVARKSESKKGFSDFLEKAETGAVGRALALLGYGTQFAGDELDEGERIVDAPQEAKKETAKS